MAPGVRFAGAAEQCTSSGQAVEHTDVAGEGGLPEMMLIDCGPGRSIRQLSSAYLRAVTGTDFAQRL